MNRGALFGIALLSATAVCADEAPAPRSLTLDQAVQIGLENATAVLKGNNDTRLAGEQVIQGYGQFLPTLDAGLSYAYNTGKTLLTFTGVTLVDSSSKNTQLSISSTLNLFNGLGDQAALNRALHARDATNLSLAWAKEQVVLDVTTSYLQVTLDQELLKNAKINLAASQGRLRLLQGQARVGSAALADLYRQQAQTSSDQLAESSAESKLRDDQVLLIRKLRLDTNQPYDFAAPPLEPKPSPLASKPIPELIQEALASRNDLKASQNRYASLGADVDRAWSGYLPKLDLGFDRSAAGHYLTREFVDGVDTLPAYQAGPFSQLGNQVEYTVSLNLSWNILDHALTRLDVATARNARDNAEVDYSDLRIQVDSDVRIAMNDYQVALGQVDTAKTGLVAADKAYESIQGRYQVGSASFIDLITAQAALTQSRANEVQSRVNLFLRKKELAYVIGKISPNTSDST